MAGENQGWCLPSLMAARVVPFLCLCNCDSFTSVCCSIGVRGPACASLCAGLHVPLCVGGPACDSLLVGPHVLLCWWACMCFVVCGHACASLLVGLRVLLWSWACLSDPLSAYGGLWWCLLVGLSHGSAARTTGHDSRGDQRTASSTAATHEGAEISARGSTRDRSSLL